MTTHTAPALSEVVLSSTHAASPLPTISLHNPLTGALVYSFRSPVASNSTGPNGAARNGVTDKDQPSLEYRTTFAAVEGSQGCGGYLVGLGGKEGRAGMHVWNFTRETTQHRLIPPVRLTTMTISRDGVYMAGGTPDGRIFLWEVSSGTLIVTIDAHYRSVSTLAFSDDGACLVSGSEDAGVSVWTMGRLLNASPMNPPAPFATLADHTLPVTDVCVGLGTFPQCRIMTASLDSTVKIWDISTTPASLLSTFSFPHPVSHIAWDALERYFFAAGPTSPSSANPAASTSTAEASSSSSGPGGSRVVRVNLFRRRKDEFGIEVTEPVGGGGRGEVERVGGEGQSQSQGQEGETYEISETITSLHLSSHSPTLLVGLANSAIHLLSLPSLLPTRVLTPPPSSTSPGPITFLTTLLRPPELGSSNADLPQRIVMPQGMGRTVVGPEDREKGGPKGRVVEMRIGAAGGAPVPGRSVAFGLSEVGSVEDLVSPVQGVPSLLAQLSAASNGSVGGATAAGGAGAGAGAAALDKERKRAHELERQVEALQRDLGRAAGVNEAMWKKVVDSALKG